MLKYVKNFGYRIKILVLKVKNGPNFDFKAKILVIEFVIFQILCFKKIALFITHFLRNNPSKCIYTT